MIDKFYTCGYEKTLVADFIGTMKAFGIKKIIDIRQLPISRRKGFSKNIFRNLLAESGIEYIHLKALGTPKEGRIASKHGEYERFFAIFAQQMETLEAKAELEIAIELVQKNICCLLCYECSHAECHRSVVADATTKRTSQEMIALDISKESKRAFFQ